MREMQAKPDVGESRCGAGGLPRSHVTCHMLHRLSTRAVMSARVASRCLVSFLHTGYLYIHRYTLISI